MTVWAAPAVAAATPSGLLNGVTCTTPSFCLAVGASGPSGASNTKALVEEWDGSDWTVQSVPSPTGATSVELNSVACGSPDACLIVGSYKSASTDEGLLAEYWDGGTWTIESVPEPSGSYAGGVTGNLLSASCSSAASCMVVGFYVTAGNTNQALSDYWDGSSFSSESVPVTDASISVLDAVSCGPGPGNNCEAEGWWNESGQSEVALLFAEQWNGTSWTEQEPSNSQSEGDYPGAISCISAVVCKSVGSGDTDEGEVAFAQTYDDGAWSNDTLPSTTGSSQLLGVSCGRNSDACQAVGGAYGSGGDSTLAETWDGSAWSITPSASPAGTFQTLASDWCTPSGDHCEAVGYYNNSAGVQKPLAEVFNGTSWHLQGAKL